MFRQEMMWFNDAEEKLRQRVAQYESSLVSIANKIAEGDGRQSVEVEDIAFAESVYRGEMLEAEERRAFLAGMGLDVPPAATLAVFACVRCNKHFKRSNPLIKHCSRACKYGLPATKEKRKKAAPLYQRICEVCGVQFMGASSRFKCDACKKIKSLIGWYVYGWYDREELFYVGMGCERRAFSCHKSATSCYAPCELRRRTAGPNFSVRIIRDRLTQTGARLIEGTLINYLQPSCNLQSGGRAMPDGDLVIYEERDLRGA